MVKLLVLVAVVCCARAAEAQSLAEAAKRAEEARKAAGATTVTFDMRDVDPSLARQELMAFRLDEAAWTRFLAADRAVAAALKGDADVLQRFQALEAESIRALEKFIFRERPLLEAVTSSGSDAREFASTHLAVLLALKEGRGAPGSVDTLPPAIRANVAFVASHEREVKTLAAPPAKLNVRVAPAPIVVARAPSAAPPRPVAASNAPGPAAAPPAADGPIDLSPGMEVPDFRFVDFHGNTRSLSDFRGKHVLLDFWGSWCPPCRAEVPYAKDAYARFKARGFEILGLDYERGASLEQVRAYLNDEGVTWTFAQPDSVRDLIVNRFQIQSFPTVILLDPDQRVVATPRSSLRGKQLAMTLDRILPR
jgi:thiol-disulfide isomerase/thioredoxin